MPRTTGTYAAPSNSVNPAVAGTNIDATDFNAFVDDLEAALTESVYTAGLGATDNRLVRTDGSDTKRVQSTGITVDDSNNISGVESITAASISGTLTNCTGLPPGTGLVTTRTSYTPTVSSSSGTITTASATGSYYDIGGLRFVDITITITTNGTGAGLVLATLPSTPAANFNNGIGRETAVAGFMLGVYGFSSSNNMSIFKLSDNTYPGNDGYVLNVQLYYRLV